MAVEIIYPGPHNLLGNVGPGQQQGADAVVFEEKTACIEWSNTMSLEDVSVPRS